MDVFVNDTKVDIYRGMKVKHALIAYDQALYEAALQGEVQIFDGNGFEIGLEGSLTERSRIFVRRKAG